MFLFHFRMRNVFLCLDFPLPVFLKETYQFCFTDFINARYFCEKVKELIFDKKNPDDLLSVNLFTLLGYITNN